MSADSALTSRVGREARHPSEYAELKRIVESHGLLAT
jgi:hypothetical protein